MGKLEDKSLHRNRRQSHDDAQIRLSPSGFLCDRCSACLAKDFSFRCVVVLLLSVALLVYGVFSIVPHREKNPGFDAQQTIKLSASAQAYFTLEKPVSELLPHIAQLEYDINAEIGAREMKVAVLSMHQFGSPNRTAVVFGALPDPITAQISSMSLSLVRSSLIEVFMQQINLTLTNTIFGQPSKFEILKFQGGITVNPEPASFGQWTQILFNFTLNNSVSEIVDNIVELKDQLKHGLHLRHNENVFVQVTNKAGSTTDTPVVIQASVITEFGNLPPQRLRQLAETITGSPAQNLGLHNDMFGKVRSISLSSYLRGTLSSLPPSPSPAPAAPEPSSHLTGHSYSPAPVPTPDVASPPRPCPPYHDPELPPSPSPMSSHPISAPASPPPAFSPRSRPSRPKLPVYPHVAPVPQVARASSPRESIGGRKGLVYSSYAPSPSLSSSATRPLYKTTPSLLLPALIISHLLCRFY